MKNKKIIIGTVIGIIVIAAFAAGWMYYQQKETSVTPAPVVTEQHTSQPIATATYSCKNGKTITAAFYEGSSTPSTAADQPPTPGGSVSLALSDGRTMTLPQTISADGARYANTDESIIFWNKGNGAFIMESSTETYADCAAPSSNGTTTAQ